jgi:hypothetical protein
LSANLHLIRFQKGNGASAAGSHFGRSLHDVVITAIDGRNIP